MAENPPPAGARQRRDEETGPRGEDEGSDGSGDEPVRCVCPVGGIADLLGRALAMQVVCVVGALGPVRYGAIAAALGEVSSSTLSTRLDELADAGLLTRRQYDEIPPRVEYALTDDGEALRERLEPLLAWVEQRDGADGRASADGEADGADAPDDDEAGGD